MARRGRPPRAGTRATHRCELRLTPVEHDAVQRLAAANAITVADVLRLGTLALVAILEEHPSHAPLVLDGNLFFVVPPEARELLPGRNQSPLRS